MGMLDVFFSRIRSAAGYNQTFLDRVKAGDISGALSLMNCNSDEAGKMIAQYYVNTHDIMKRQDKAIYDDEGNFKGWVKRWKLPLNYHMYINEIALVFIYGRPVKWLEQSQNTSKAYSAFIDFISDTHFNSKVRKAKRLAGIEKRSALLFHTFQNKDGKADCLIKVVANSLGDDLYCIKDQFDRLQYFARGYYLSDRGNKTVYHIDIYTDEMIYQCKRGNMGWDVTEQRNFIGKKPVILFEQEEEWFGAQALIERQEYIKSRTADVNDYMADPALVATADVIKGMPEKDSENKLYILSEKGQLNYLIPDTANELKRQEMEDNEKHILRDTFTPNIDFENMLKLSNVSAKALEQLMTLANIKAEKRKESHDEYMKRTSSLIISILKNVLHVELSNELSNLRIEHEFQKPFADDVAEVITNLNKSYDSGVLSDETYIELNPLVKDSEREKQRLAKETKIKDEKAIEQMKYSIFNPAE